MTFQQYCEAKHIRMKPWQMAAATAFLEKMRPHKSPGTGKSFLARTLYAFVDEQGAQLELEPEVKAGQKRRGHDAPPAHDHGV